MKTIISVIALAVLTAATATAEEREVVFGLLPGVVSGEDAADIVRNGQILAVKSEGIEGFLMLIEYLGETYTCTVTANGRVLPCHELEW